jgi:hypothetical protein
MPLLIEGLGHEVALVFSKAAAAVEFYGGVAVIDFEVEKFGFVLASGGFGEIKKLRANSLPAVRSLDEEFVNPRTLSAVFEAVVETDHQIADRRKLFVREVDHAVNRIRQQLGKIRADRGLVEWLRPGIIFLHEAHHRKQGFDICGSGTCNRDGHEMRSRLSKENEIGDEDHTTAAKAASSREERAMARAPGRAKITV